MRGAVKITYGYSKDHRPDLKQAVVTLVTSQKGHIPLWLEALDGNSSDKNSFRQSVDAYCRHLAEGELPCFVLDSAAYTADNIAQWSTQKQWLTRVPETISETRSALQIEPTTSEYGGVSQRWLIVYSEQAEQSERKQLNKRVARAATQAEKAVKKLNNQEFTCEKMPVRQRQRWPRS